MVPLIMKTYFQMNNSHITKKLYIQMKGLKEKARTCYCK